MKTSKSLDEILEKLADDHFYLGTEVGDEDYASDGYTANIAEAKQAIVEAVEGLAPMQNEPVIPAAEIDDTELITLTEERTKLGRNLLRAEIRQAIKEWQ